MSESNTAAPSPTTYNGRPCKNCGGTLRRCCNRNCVVCDRQRKRDKADNDPEWAERERQRKSDWYYNLNHVAYYSRQLRERARKGAQRVEARRAAREDLRQRRSW